MPLNKQSANFPPLGMPEISWAENIRKAMEFVHPAPVVAYGLKMGIGSGLIPSLTDGWLVDGDKVMGPYGSKLIAAAPASETNNFYFGLEGTGYYDTAAATPKDAFIGSVLASADSVIHVAQFSRSTSGFFAVRGVVNLEDCTKGADVDLITWTKPDVGLPNTRIVYAHAKVLAAVSAGNTAGDDFLLKVGSTTLVTKDDANLVTVGHTDVAASLPTYGESTTSLVFKYNQTDTSTAIAGGQMEVYALLECF